CLWGGACTGAMEAYHLNESDGKGFGCFEHRNLLQGWGKMPRRPWDVGHRASIGSPRSDRRPPVGATAAAAYVASAPLRAPGVPSCTRLVPIRAAGDADPPAPSATLGRTSATPPARQSRAEPSRTCKRQLGQRERLSAARDGSPLNRPGSSTQSW